AWEDDGVIQRGLRTLRQVSRDLVLTTDVCLCEYTSHGHCGPLDGEDVDNDAALELLARTAVSHAEAGADVVCPSDMMDGRVGAYNASGEYAMLKASAARGWIDERAAALESLTAIVRAGADLVVSYWTKELATWL